MGLTVRLDHAGIAELLKSDEVRTEIDHLAEEVAAHVREDSAVQRHDAPVVTSSYTTDRAAAAVSIAHPGGLGIQAKYGALTHAAGEAGLEVRVKGGAASA